MIRTLRLKFICVTMAIVTVLMCVIFGLIIHFTAESLRVENEQLLRNAASEPFQTGRPGQAVIPCFVIRVTPWGNTVESSGGFDLSDEQMLADILARALSEQAELGVIEDYSLRYLRQESMMGFTITFTDMSTERTTVRNLTLTCLAIGAAAFLAFWGVSILLARWAVKPVEKAWKEQRQFIADASHELKTPLTVIMTNAELLQSPTEAEQQEQYARSILTMSQQMRSLVEGLLELARVDNGAARSVFEELDLSELVSGELLPFEPVYFERGLSLNSDIAEGLCVSGSAGHLRQVIGILLDNAMKYTPGEGAVWVRLVRQNNQALISVANPGEELSREDRQNIFRRFYRVDQARTSGGYGLGLPIAQGIVADHGGKIWADSHDGWNIFYVQLPLKRTSTS